MYLSRRQGKEKGVSICPVTAPEVKQPLLFQAVVQALSYACQHVQCKSTPPLLAQEYEGQPYESLPGSLSDLVSILADLVRQATPYAMGENRASVWLPLYYPR